MSQIKIVKEQKFPNGDSQALWSCGCVTSKIGDHFYISPCSEGCLVLKITLEESKKRGNIIEIRHFLRGWDME